MNQPSIVPSESCRPFLVSSYLSGSRLTVSLLTFFLLTSSALSAGPNEVDYTPVKQAAGNFAIVMERLSREMPQTHDAATASKMLEDWAAANMALVTSIQTLLKAHPELIKVEKPPPDIEGAFTAMYQVKDKYPAVPPGMASLIKQFGADPRMFAAARIFQQSIQALQRVVGPDDLDSAGKVFRELTAVDAAMDHWGIEHGKKLGDVPTTADLIVYFKPGSRLQETAQKGQILDTLGNPIMLSPLGTRPTLSRATFASFSAVVREDFWKPFPVR